MIKKIIGNKIFLLDVDNKIISEKILLKPEKKYTIGIIIDSPIVIPPTTGVTYRLYYLSKALSELGYNQVWFIGNRNHKDLNSINLLKNDYVKIHLLPPDKLYNYEYLSSLIKLENIDILQFELSETFLTIAPKLKEINKLPIVLETHDIEASLRESLGRSNEIDLMKFIQYSACSMADAVVVMTPNDYNSLIDDIGINQNKLFLAPNGVNIHNQTININFDKPVLIFLGNMYYPPNQQGLIFTIENVLPIVLKSNPNIILKIIGMVPDNIRNLYQNENVIFTGEITNDIEFRDYLSSGSLGLCILFSGSGMKVKVLDYCINKLPIILTKVGLSGYEKNTSFILVDENADSIANAIINLLSDKDKLISLGEKNCKFAIENFSWDSICNKIIEAYDSAYNFNQDNIFDEMIELPKPFVFEEGRDKDVADTKHFLINKNIIKEF